MYFNLHTLPAGQAMFTVHILQPGESYANSEEVDVVCSDQTESDNRLVGQVLEAAREGIVKDYGPKTLVIGLVNQSSGHILFNSLRKGHIPLPVVLPARVTEAFERPYAALLELASDDIDGAYREFLLAGE